jgi:hypothetical protein
MKTKIFITAGCLMLIVFTFGQNKQPSKAEMKAMEVENSIQSGRYEIAVNKANPMGGNVRHLTSDYSVRISGDSTYVFLPYFGRAYSAPLNGEGGIKVATIMDNYKIDFKERKGYSINYIAKGTDDTYRFSITIWTNGNATIHVSCNHRQAISYLGNLELSN